MIGAQAFAGQRDGKRLILRVVAGSTILLLFFTIAGTWVLRLFGVTVSDLRIGGGLLLLVIALRIVVWGRFGHDGEESHTGLVVPLIYADDRRPRGDYRFDRAGEELRGLDNRRRGRRGDDRISGCCSCPRGSFIASSATPQPT